MTRDPDDPTRELMLDQEFVYVDLPERYWMATRDDFPALQDPDIEEGQARNREDGVVRWHELGELLTEISTALTEGLYTEHRDEELAEPGQSVKILTPSAPADGLTVAEVYVFDSWWGTGTAPTADPWADLLDGRHRLWNIWKHNPTAVLPIRSDALDQIGQLSLMGQKGLENLPEDHRQLVEGQARFTAELTRSSPLYVAAIATAIAATAP